MGHFAELEVWRKGVFCKEVMWQDVFCTSISKTAIVQ